jgi:hypothetical protein
MNDPGFTTKFEIKLTHLSTDFHILFEIELY